MFFLIIVTPLIKETICLIYVQSWKIFDTTAPLSHPSQCHSINMKLVQAIGTNVY